MHVVERMESAVEQVVDGFFRLLLGGRIQPLEIARRLTREAEQQKIISLSRVYVPNHFLVGLHPADMATLKGVAPELECEFQNFVAEWLAERNYSVPAPVRVELNAAQRVGRGRMQISCTMTERPGDPVDDEGPPTGDSPAPASTPTVGRLLAVDGPDHSRVFRLFPRRSTIGRAADCDIRLRDPLVSRHHAVIEPHESSWRLIDLDSKNGTLLNDAELEQGSLRGGDRLQLGDTVFLVELDAGEGERAAGSGGSGDP